jgi:microcin C transport system substrate-binding protein
MLVGASQRLSADSAQALGYMPKYPATFHHFDYINADAPKGGSITLPAFGSYDTLNPYTLKGIVAAGVGELLFETLMEQSLDEPFSQYGLLAGDVKLAADRLSVIYRIRDDARFHDGTPVTAEDVKFSFDTLKSKAAHPRYRFYWSDITAATVVDPMTIRFNFSRVNPELHMIAGTIPIFPRSWVGKEPFDKVALKTPMASGPYRIARYELGKYITFERNPDYWARALPVRRGMYNFDRITFKYYRDTSVALEAFKAGEFDFMAVYNSKEWARDYTGPKFDQGILLKKLFRHSNNAGMQGFVFNLRRKMFQDIRVRRAISLALDFEWSNRKLFYNQYERCDSYFSNSELAAHGIPEGAELALLEPFRKQLPQQLFTETWQPPSTNPPGSLRDNLRQAKKLLEEAGWRYQDGALRNAAGEPLRFEVMLTQQQKGFERIVAPFARNLAKLGIEVTYRNVDSALYQRRSDTFDFDMMVQSFPQSMSPGNELIDKFHSSTATQEGSNNVLGLKDPVVDALIDKVIYAKDRQQLVIASRALDRVLLWGEYLVPNWYIDTHRAAYKNRFGYPETTPLYYDVNGWMLATWWVDERGIKGGE